MNYCTKCQSIYSEPGTCNCYAAQGESQPWTIPLGDTMLAPRCESCGSWHILLSGHRAVALSAVGMGADVQAGLTTYT